MNKPWQIAAYFVAVIVLVIGMVAGLVVLFGGDEPADNTSASPSSVTSTPPPLLGASPTPSAGEPMEEVTDQLPCVRDRELLRSRSQQFAVAWQTLKPEDTTASREARLKPYVVSEFFRTPQNSVSIETDVSKLPLAEQARITQRITQTAKASNDEVEVVCSTTVDDEAATTVNVSVWTENAHGTQLAPPLPESLSINWRLVNSVWRATLVTPN